MNFKYPPNSLAEKYKLAREGCEPVSRVPATGKHMGGGGVGLLDVGIKRQCH